MLTSLLKVMGSRSMELIGVDLAPQMLERARRRLSARAAGVGLCRAEVATLPFRDNEMDLVMSALTLEYASDPVSVLRDMMRVVRSNAKLLLVTTRACAPNLPYQIVFGYKHFEPDQVPHWMEEAGVQNVIRQPLAGIARWFGQAYVGRKAKVNWHVAPCATLHLDSDSRAIRRRSHFRFEVTRFVRRNCRGARNRHS